MRISVFQLICLATTVGALAALLFHENRTALTWRNHPLEYRPPEVPASYNAPIKPSFTPLLPGILFREGGELFRKLHHAGWQANRYHYYAGFELADQPYKLRRSLDSIDLAQDPASSAATLAYASGNMQCQRQIDQLLETYEPAELRTLLATPKPAQRWPLCLLMAFSLICFFWARIRMHPRRTNQ